MRGTVCTHDTEKYFGGHTCCKICNVLTTSCILFQFTPNFSAKVTSLCSAIPRFLIFALSILAGKYRCYEFGAKI